jgi:hypothetical protein
MSNLVRHAEEEMRRAGLYDADADYGGMIPKAVMKLVEAHASEGHSGGSHHMVMAIFNKVINFEPLTPLSSNPEEWMKVDPDHYQPGTWQNRRKGSTFSRDGGKTWYDIDTPGSWITCCSCQTHFPVALTGVRSSPSDWFCSDTCLATGKKPERSLG